MFNYKPWREGKKGWKQSGEEVSEKVRERTVTQIAEETFCLKSDLAGKRLRIAQNGRVFFSPLFSLGARAYRFQVQV